MRNEYAELFSSTIVRQEFEKYWRRKLKESYERYQAASTRYRGLLQEELAGQVSSPDGPLALARREEFETLAEFTRLLKMFAELTLDGRVPQGQPAPAPSTERKRG